MANGINRPSNQQLDDLRHDLVKVDLGSMFFGSRPIDPAKNIAGCYGRGECVPSD